MGWAELVKKLEEEFAESGGRHWKQITVCIDGLDEHWDCTPPSLHFLAQLLQVAKSMSVSMPHCLRFVICLRDNIFRALVETGSIEYDKLEASICYLYWDHRSLFEMVAKRAFSGEDGRAAANRLRGLLPATVDGVDIEEYLGWHILSRPRDYINFFSMLRDKCASGGRVAEACVREVVGNYCAYRLMDLENEFAHTYPGIGTIVENLQDLPAVCEKQVLMDRLEEMCASSKVRRAAPSFMMHHGKPMEVARILMSVGVIGFFDEKERVLKFVHEFSEGRLGALLDKK
jgi:hypothetical protein